jgi:hypothetical protein
MTRKLKILSAIATLSAAAAMAAPATAADSRAASSLRTNGVEKTFSQGTTGPQPITLPAGAANLVQCLARIYSLDGKMVQAGIVAPGGTWKSDGKYGTIQATIKQDPDGNWAVYGVWEPQTTSKYQIGYVCFGY